MVLVVVLWLVASAVVIALGLVHASHGMADVDQARAHLSASDVVSRSATGPLHAAVKEFNSAYGFLHSPLVAPLDIVPVIGRQLRSVQDLSSASGQVATIGADAIDQAHSVLESSHSSGTDRVEELRALAQLATKTDKALGRIDTGPAHALVSPLASKHDTFVRDLTDVRTRLQHAAGVAGTMADILQGPQTYLLLMANNAEMRAGSGDFLEVGALAARDGHLELSNVNQTVNIPVAPGKVTVTGDLEARWGWIKPGQDWRNLGFTPQFDVNGPLAAQMWEAETGQHVDGVIAVDVEGLHQILEVTGPVTLHDGTVVGAGDVEQLLTHDQYKGLVDQPSGAPARAEGSREDRLGALAQAALGALENESLDLKSLSNAMTTATQGRHLLMWSENAQAESAWVQAGVAGQLSPDSMTTAVINRGGNKLDQYLSVASDLDLKTQGTHTQGTLTVHLKNSTPPGQSQFIAGPYPGLGTVYGEYLGVLAVNLPGYASTPRIEGNPPLDALGAEGPTWVIATPVDVKAGQSQTVVVRFTLPQASGEVRVLPTARLAPVTWHYRGTTETDAGPFSLSW
ncbi:MAG TPA: DUF4012 domain-containing protein [Acidimicrobiales bacterium]|nr:DUF4012 domain-containing protein [Acidimicrobiales bacterium]